MRSTGAPGGRSRRLASSLGHPTDCHCCSARVGTMPYSRPSVSYSDRIVEVFREQPRAPRHGEMYGFDGDWRVVGEAQTSEEHHLLPGLQLERCGHRRRGRGQLELKHLRARLHPLLADILGERHERVDGLADGLFGHVRAASVAAYQPSVAFELRERLSDGDAADVKLLAEPPFGRHLRIRRPVARFDQLLDGLLQLKVERNGARLTEARQPSRDGAGVGPHGRIVGGVWAERGAVLGIAGMLSKLLGMTPHILHSLPSNSWLFNVYFLAP